MSEEFYENDNETDKTNLIVNYLPQAMTDEEFENLFKKFGSMKSCKIVRNRVNGYSYGFGFVDFENHDQALKAIEELNGLELETKKIKVAFARPAGQDIKQANLYIKNVPHSWTQDDVKRVFEPYGKIIQVRVLSNNRGIAFVLFDLRKQAEDALEALNGKTLDGCEAPFEIKFAADKKIEKGSSNKASLNNNNNNSNNNNNNNNSTNNNNSSNNNAPGTHKRERGNRGGRNRDHYRNKMQNRRNRNNQGGNYYDRQNYDDRQQNPRGNQAQYNAMSYGGNSQYPSNFNLNGVGPVRQSQNNRMNRYTPFIPVQQPMISNPATPLTSAPMAPMSHNPAFGYPPQPMIPFAMLPTPQIAPIQPVNQAGQIVHNQMGMYGAPMSIGYPQVTQNALNNMYSVASNNLTNAANMQPQIGQPMTMRNSMNAGHTGDGQEDGVTLFVYNIGPDADETELRSMFAPYGNVVKCNVVRKSPGGETKGFGFVTMRDRDQASAAIAGLDRSMKNGRALQVSLKK